MATKKKAVVVEETAPVDVDPQDPGLPGTPADASIPDEDYVPLGVAVDEPWFDAPEDAEEGDAKDEPAAPLEATDSETVVHDTTAGSTRPEDGFAAE